MKIYRLEKNGRGPFHHPKHGWPSKKNLLVNKKRILKRVLIREFGITNKLKKHILEFEPEGTIQQMLDRWVYRKIKEGYSVYHLRNSLRFACKTPDILKKYCGTKYFNRCIQLGFKIVEYNIDGRKLVWCPNKIQCIFSIDDVTK